MRRMTMVRRTLCIGLAALAAWCLGCDAYETLLRDAISTGTPSIESSVANVSEPAGAGMAAPDDAGDAATSLDCSELCWCVYGHGAAHLTASLIVPSLRLRI